MIIKKRYYTFINRTSTICFILLFFASVCNGQQKTKIFPLQQLTGNTDSMLKSRYLNDTANFQKIEQTFGM